jgi:hypothetical protein
VQRSSPASAPNQDYPTASDENRGWATRNTSTTADAASHHAVLTVLKPRQQSQTASGSRPAVGGYAQLCANDFTDKSTKILFTDPALHQQPLCDLDALREPPSPDNDRSSERTRAGRAPGSPHPRQELCDPSAPAEDTARRLKLLSCYVIDVVRSSFRATERPDRDHP